MTKGRRPGGAVALTGLVTFLMLFGLAAAPIHHVVPVLDRIEDILVLSLYTVGAATLLLPPSETTTAGHDARRMIRASVNGPAAQPGARQEQSPRPAMDS